MKPIAEQPTRLTRKEIKEFLPHRWPWLFLTKALIYPDNRIAAFAKIPMFLIGVNSFLAKIFRLGHFPDKPIVPGVLLAELIAQATALKLLYAAEEGKRPQQIFLLECQIKCHDAVSPGQKLLVKVEIEYSGRIGCRAKGDIYFRNQDGSPGKLAASGSVTGVRERQGRR